MTTLNHTLFGVRGASFVIVVLKAGGNVILHNVVADVTSNVIRFYAVTDNPNVGGAFIVQFSHAEVVQINVTTVN